MFLIDKYRITDNFNILYHNEIYDKLFEKKDFNKLLNQENQNLRANQTKRLPFQKRKEKFLV